MGIIGHISSAGLICPIRRLDYIKYFIKKKRKFAPILSKYN
jgi:hypothetical protein